MKLWRFVGTGALAVGTIAGAALAAQPTKDDMDFCDQKAAEVSKAAPVKPGAGTTPPSTPQPGSNTTGGRVTDSTQSYRGHTYTVVIDPAHEAGERGGAAV